MNHLNHQTKRSLYRILFAVGLALIGATHCGGGKPIPPDLNTLSVSVIGVGSGTVTSDVGGIACQKTAGTCDADIESGTTVTLTATPDKGNFFKGWFGGPCQGVSTCSVSLNQITSVQASFVNVLYISERNLDPSQDAPEVPGPNSNSNVWLSNSDGTNPTSLTQLTVPNVFSDLPIFSPDGTQVAFISNRNLDSSDSETVNNCRNIWIATPGGNPPLKVLAGIDVTNAGVAFGMADWSPDGSKIVFGSPRDINGAPTVSVSGEANVWVVNQDNTGLAVLAPLDVTGVQSGETQWSPDGSRILFASSRNVDKSPTLNPNGNDNIWVMNADGSQVTPLTQVTVTNGNFQAPRWSPDGTRIAFHSNRSLSSDQNGTPADSNNIWVMNADGSNPLPITDNDGGANAFNGFPQWSPDGTRLAFFSNRSVTDSSSTAPAISTDNVWTVASDGSSGPVPVTNRTIARSDWPFWAPDGSALLYESNQSLTSTDQGAVANPAVNIWIFNGTTNASVTSLMNADSFSPVDLD